MVDVTKTNLLTHRECVQRGKIEGLPITENALRQWTRSGKLPVRRVGNKGLIFWPNVVRFLTCEDGCDNGQAAPQVSGGIRRIEL